MEDKSVILIVDDARTNIDILLNLLGNYDVVVAMDGESALESAEQEKPDLILLDIMMPGLDGFDVCRRLKDSVDTKNIPIIFLTSRTDENSIEKAYDIGGSDYITKPFKPRELLARVKTQLKLRELINNLEHLAAYDQMTGIYNRRKFFALSIQRFEEAPKDLFVVMIDIDKFKAVNDNYGHAVGDEVIKLVTKTISENISKDSIFGRIGGEEFALVCSHISDESIVEKIDSIRKIIEALEIVTDDGRVVKFTISEGIAKVQESTRRLDEVLKQADVALYEAKGSGRNRVIFR